METAAMPLANIYVAVSLGFATWFGALHARGSASVARAMVRSLALGALAVVCLIEGADLVAFALLIAAAEGVATASSRRLALAWGLGLLWRATYLAAFLAAGAGLGFTPAAVVVQGGVLAAVAAVVWRYWDRLRGVRAGVIATAAASALLGATALGSPSPLTLAAAGALLLLLADLAIGWNIFGAGRKARFERRLPQAVWAAIYLGHALIAAPFLTPPV